MSIEMLNHNKKISKALQLLNEAATDKKDELTRGFDRVREHTTDMIDETGGKIKRAATTIDKKVHKYPWKYLGGALAAGALLGFVFGALKKKK